MRTQAMHLTAASLGLGVLIVPALAASRERVASTPPPRFAIAARVVLTPDADGEHVTFPTQNGSTITLDRRDLVGKTVVWATVAGGDSVNNAPPIDHALTTLGEDLTSTWVSPPSYATGSWELACLVSVSGLPKPFVPGDLGARDVTAPLPGEPPLTGATVRVRVEGADAPVVLTNANFRRFGFPP